uniref:Uncharacterized protein n=2 Tax=Sus scrofa TaxID=9823 RepID=A0ABB5UQX3_PIG
MRHLLEQRDRAPVCLGKRREDRQTTRKGLGGIKTQQHHRNVERGPAKSQTRPPNRLHRKRPEAQAEVKDPVSSLLRLRSQLWCGFDPWLRNFHLLRVWPKKEKKEERKKNVDCRI